MSRDLTERGDTAVKTSALRRLMANEELNFVLTNRVPRIAMTRLVGWISRIEQPWFAALAIRVWSAFTDLDLSESPPQRYRSLRECFTRPLLPGARRIDADPASVTSPSDAIVGACGTVEAQQVLQAKGLRYTLPALFGSVEAPQVFEQGTYVTLRLTSAMYHRFHAPHDFVLEHVVHIAGDTWNVNPAALARVPDLFCRNERAVLSGRLADGGAPIALVPVAAVAVASLRLHALDLLLRVGWRGPHRWDCAARYAKGDELGWFEQGSTIIVFLPRGFVLAPGVAAGRRIRMGEPLARRAA